MHVGITRTPTDEWTAQQLREATPYGEVPKYLIRDNDAKYGSHFGAIAIGSGIEVLRTPVQAPRANAICERLMGSVRRECLDHIMILSKLTCGVSSRSTRCISINRGHIKASTNAFLSRRTAQFATLARSSHFPFWVASIMSIVGQRDREHQILYEERMTKVAVTGTAANYPGRAAWSYRPTFVRGWPRSLSTAECSRRWCSGGSAQLATGHHASTPPSHVSVQLPITDPCPAPCDLS